LDVIVGKEWNFRAWYGISVLRALEMVTELDARRGTGYLEG
jgi:hypothetical protein